MPTQVANKTSQLTDPLRVCQKGCLFFGQHRFCAWHGTPLAPVVGLQLGQFRIERPISTKGGFGVVYYARNVNQKEIEAAIKILKPPHCYNKEMVHIFLHESGLGRGLAISQIPRIFDVAREPWPHITMEYIEGCTLQDELRRLREDQEDQGSSAWISIKDARGMMQGIATALQASHARDLNHRDLKPLNILLTEERNGPAYNWVKVIDWGIAMKLGEAKTATGGVDSSRSGMTAEMVQKRVSAMGSPAFMAPEHFKGKTGKPSDIYQFGLIAFELLTGEPPYNPPATRDVDEWENVHKFQAPKDLRSLRREVPRSLARIIARCLEKEPEKRFQDGGELLEALSRQEAPRYVKVLLGLVVAMLCLAIYLGFRVPPPVPLPRFFGGNELCLKSTLDPRADTEEGFEPPRIFYGRLDRMMLCTPDLLTHDFELQDIYLEAGSGSSYTRLDPQEVLGSSATVGADYYVRIEPPGPGELAGRKSRINFATIARYIQSTGGPLTDARYDFAVSGTARQKDETGQFRQRFSVQLDDKEPAFADVQLALDLDGKRLELDLLDPATAAKDAARRRIYVPPGRKGLQAELSVRVAGELESSVVLTRNGVSATMLTTPQQPSVHRSTIPIPDSIPTSGADERLVVVARDPAENQSGIELVLVYDSGTNANPSGSKDVEKLPDGRGRVTVYWQENGLPTLEDSQVELALLPQTGAPLAIGPPKVSLHDLERNLWHIEFALDQKQLDRLRASSETWQLQATIKEAYANPGTALANSSMTWFLRPDGEPRPTHFENRIEVVFEGGQSALLKRLRYPQYVDDERFVHVTTKEPLLLRLWQTESGRRQTNYEVDWSKARWTKGVAPKPEDYSDGDKRGVQVDLRSLGDATTELELSAPTYWGGGDVVLPIVIRRLSDERALAERLEMYLRSEETGKEVRSDGGSGPNAIAIASLEKQSLDVVWRPELESVDLRVNVISGVTTQTPAGARVTKELIDAQDKRIFSTPLVGTDDLPLGEGIYRLIFNLRDVFGNSTNVPVLLLVNGAKPLIEPECAASDRCEIKKKGKEPAYFRCRIGDRSGLSRIELAVDGAPITGSGGEANLLLLKPSELEGLGVGFESADDLSGFRTGVVFVYSDFKVGDRKQLEISAADGAGPERVQTQSVLVSCNTEMLPEVVSYLGMDWIRAEHDGRTFYISKYEVCSGFYDDPEGFFTSGKPRTEEQRRPKASLAPQTMWSWAREHGFYLPTLSQWLAVATGKSSRYRALIQPNALRQDPDAKELAASVHCGYFREPLPVDVAPAGWEAYLEKNEGMFLGTLHLFGNVAEVVLAGLPPPRELEDFHAIGGTYNQNLADCLVFEQPRIRAKIGFRLTVYHEDYRENGVVIWEKNPAFQAALSQAQNQ